MRRLWLLLVTYASTVVTGSASTCEDSATTGFYLSNNPASCAQLAALGACSHSTFGCDISAACPLACNACQRCDVAVTQYTLGGVLATCPALAFACSHTAFGAAIRAACPETCGCGYCFQPPPPSPLLPPPPPMPPVLPDHLRPPESPPTPPPPISPAPLSPPPALCEDTVGNTRFSLGGQYADCAQLASVGACTHSTYGCEIRRTCPAACDDCYACDATTAAATGVTVSGVPQTCAQLASLGFCVDPNDGPTVQAACGQTCDCGVCLPRPPPSPPAPPNPPLAPRCVGLLDFVVVLDASGSVSGSAAEIQAFALSIVDRLELAPGAVQLGLITFNLQASLALPALTSYLPELAHPSVPTDKRPPP